jgi:hypothetical protein
MFDVCEFLLSGLYVGHHWFSERFLHQDLSGSNPWARANSFMMSSLESFDCGLIARPAFA